MKKILLIEDEESYSKLLSDTLTAGGFSVILAEDGETGLALAKKEKPDLILLDLLIPKLDGLTMLNLIRKDEEIKNTEVVILSALDASDQVRAKLINTPTYYVVKTETKLTDLVEKIKQLVGE